MLSNSCDTITGVGTAIMHKLQKCGIKSLADLIFHVPYRYQDRTRITPISDTKPKQWCVISGKIIQADATRIRKKSWSCVVSDGSGSISLRFFHIHPTQIQKLKQQATIRAFGEINFRSHQPEMVHPEYQILQEDEICVVDEALTPIYPSTQGLSQKRLRQLIIEALNIALPALKMLEWMPSELLKQQDLLPLDEAILFLHQPTPDTNLSSLESGSHPALKRLIIDELTANYLSMWLARLEKTKQYAPAMQSGTEIMKALITALPFALTNAQQRVIQEIILDLTKITPMLRLVQGDVGSGKTIVAAITALIAIKNGYQVAIMAPTDLLTEQHFKNISEQLTKYSVQCERLSGQMKVSQRKKIIQQLSDGSCQCIIGTHALFQDSVTFKNLGLVIIDEQHRFGVEQRLLLNKKGNANGSPHQLFLTATPIPRTLAMTHFAHIDISIIDELPPGRTPIQTAIIHQDRRDEIITRLKVALNLGKQIYWVCTLIESSEKLQCTAAIDSAQLLKEQLPEASIGIVHGKMKASDKESVMIDFKNGNLDILVATTVIEVGVDVPNATLMVIENSERLGLSQLHQLRGRVGRGTQASYCILLYQQPLSKTSQERLKVMRSTTDGFKIAELDLKLRGGGEILGTRQSGYRQFKVANPIRDNDILKKIPLIVKPILNQPSVVDTITTRWLGDYQSFLQG